MLDHTYLFREFPSIECFSGSTYLIRMERLTELNQESRSAWRRVEQSRFIAYLSQQALSRHPGLMATGAMPS
jgi:hypothetical protein